MTHMRWKRGKEHHSKNPPEPWVGDRNKDMGTPTFRSRKRRTRPVKNGPDQTRTGQVPPRNAQRATAAWLPGRPEQLGIFCLPGGFYGSKFSRHMFGHPGTCSATCSGTILRRSLQSHHWDPQHKHAGRALDQFSFRTGQDMIRNFDNRQDIDEHTQHCSRHKHVLFYVECRTLLQISGGLFASACPRAWREQISFVIDTVPSQA